MGQHRLDWNIWVRVWRLDYSQGTEGYKTTLVMILGIGCIAKLFFFCFFFVFSYKHVSV